MINIPCPSAMSEKCINEANDLLSTGHHKAGRAILEFRVYVLLSTALLPAHFPLDVT